MSLSQSSLHDFGRDTFNLDVHLKSGHTIFGTCHLEVHVAEVIFVAENVGENGKLVAFLDEPHGNTCHVILERHTGVEHRQAAAADGSHRGGTIGFADFGNHANRVVEFFGAGQHCLQSALGETTMTDFTTLGAAHATGFAGSKRRHVVMHDEAIAAFAHDVVDDLFILLGTERGEHQSLRFTTGKEGRTVGTRQNRLTDFDRANRTGIATVNTGLAFENIGANDVGFHFEEDAVNFVHVGNFGACGFGIR